MAEITPVAALRKSLEEQEVKYACASFVDLCGM